MEKFSKDLKNLANKVISHEQKEMIPLTNNEKKLYEKQKVIIHSKNSFAQIKNMKKNLN